MTRIAHLDVDAFYASVELLRRPELRGKPVIVSSGGPRAVVTTASYEARVFGVGSAMPTSRARRLCPHATLVAPDFSAYRAASAQVMELVRAQVECVEVVGLDEAYLELTGSERPLEILRRVKAAVRERTGLGCSIGVGPSKLVAKVASDAEKPDGFLVLTRDEALARFAGAPPELLPGIGARTAARLDRRGIRTLAQLAAAPDESLAAWFGARLGPWLGALARFEDDRALETARVARSESRETTFDRDLRDLEDMERVLDRLSAALCAALAGEGRRGRTVSIKVRLADFSTHTRARTLETATNELPTVAGVARELLRAFEPPRPVRLLGVRVAGLDEPRREAAPELDLPAAAPAAQANGAAGDLVSTPRP